MVSYYESSSVLKLLRDVCWMDGMQSMIVSMVVLPQLYATLWLLIVIAISDVSSFSSIPDQPIIPPNNNQHHQQHQSKPQPLPISDNSYTLLGFDYLSPPKDFALVQRAYRNLARQYHPDVVVGPDATEEERNKANVDFMRINEAYEDIKSRKDEEEIEVVIMGGNFDNGKRGKYIIIHMLSLCLDICYTNYTN